VQQKRLDVGAEIDDLERDSLRHESADEVHAAQEGMGAMEIGRVGGASGETSTRAQGGRAQLGWHAWVPRPAGSGPFRLNQEQSELALFWLANEITPPPLPVIGLALGTRRDVPKFKKNHHPHRGI
jgi:hypothetical protein